MRGWAIALVISVLGAAGIAFAQTPAGRPAIAPKNDAVKRNLQRWKELPPGQKEALRERMKKFQSLPPEQKERLRGMIEKLRSLPPEQRQALQQKMKALPPEVRHRLAQRAMQTGRFPRAEFAVATKVCELVKSLPPEERKRMNSLPPDQRKKEVLALGRRHFSDQYRGTLGESERAEFDALPSEDQWKRLKPWLGKTLGGGEARSPDGPRPPHREREGEPRPPKPGPR